LYEFVIFYFLSIIEEIGGVGALPPIFLKELMESDQRSLVGKFIRNSSFGKKTYIKGDHKGAFAPLKILWNREAVEIKLILKQ
jgi:hypothetical protein